MGSRRTLITIAAVAVGAIAVVLIYGYVGSVKDEAFGDAERVKVYVVKTTVAQGTYGEEAQQQKLIVEDEIPKKFFPPNAIRNFDDIGGKVAVAELAVNQIVTTDMFADPSVVQSTFSDRLEKINDEDQVAITISVDQVRGVAGLLQPGDFVNIMAVEICEVDVSAATTAEGGEEGGVENSAPCVLPEDVLFSRQARYIFQKAQVLAVGQTPVTVPGEVTAASEDPAAGGDEAEAASEMGDTGLITLIVPARAAQYVASIPPENVYLSLVSRDYEPVPQTAIDPSAELPAENPDVLTPYGPKGPGGE